MYVVHELAAKGNIVENIPPQGMTETRCRRLAAGIVAGLQFIHRNNIVHRYSNRSNHRLSSVGIDLKELGGQLPKCLKFCPRIEI